MEPLWGRRRDSGFGAAEKVGAPISTEATEQGGRGSGDPWISFVSPDGRYPFLTSRVGRENDVFRVDAEVIEELRPSGD